MAPVSMAMLILGWCSLLYGVTEVINSLKFHADKRKASQAQAIPTAEEVAEEITEVSGSEDSTGSDAPRELPTIED